MQVLVLKAGSYSSSTLLRWFALLLLGFCALLCLEAPRAYGQVPGRVSGRALSRSRPGVVSMNSAAGGAANQV